LRHFFQFGGLKINPKNTRLAIQSFSSLFNWKIGKSVSKLRHFPIGKNVSNFETLFPILEKMAQNEIYPIWGFTQKGRNPTFEGHFSLKNAVSPYVLRAFFRKSQNDDS